MSKRLRFVISAMMLSLGFIGIQFMEDSFKLPAIALLVLLTGAFSTWSFFEGLGFNMTLLSLILPMLFTLGVGTFWFLLPVSIYTQIPMIVFFGIGMYMMCLTMNMYTVSSLRTIALLSAASGVGFVLTLLTGFLMFDAMLSLRQNLIFTLPLVLLSSFLLFWQGFWSINLEKDVDKEIVSMSFISGLLMTELSSLIFFWPVTVVVGSLFLTCGVYLLLGLGQAKIEESLFPNVTREYLTVGMIVLLGMFFATHWGGWAAGP